MFWRQLKYGDFDISEMSLSSFFIATDRGETDWIGLPIYTMRMFFHTGIQVRADAKIKKPADLKGKRVGVPEYQQTSAIWSRGILEYEFGVKAKDIEWFMERLPDRSHGGATGFKPPKGVKLNQIPDTTNIGEMLMKKELDATLLYLTDRNLVDRSRIDIDSAPDIRLLFPDREAEARRYYAKTGIFPINHAMVMRRSLLKKYPWIPLNIFSAFLRAKEEVAATADSMLAPYFSSGLLCAEVKKTLAEIDPLAYGVKAARPVLEMISRFVHEQGLTKRRVKVEELFAPSTLDV